MQAQNDKSSVYAEVQVLEKQNSHLKKLLQERDDLKRSSIKLVLQSGGSPGIGKFLLRVFIGFLLTF